jgi:hypothetical protein
MLKQLVRELDAEAVTHPCAVIQGSTLHKASKVTFREKICTNKGSSLNQKNQSSCFISITW